MNSKNPKKMWEILKDLTVGKSDQIPIDKIKKGRETVNDPQQIAEEFNSFFTKAGRNIADSVEPIAVQPTDFLPNTNPPNLDLKIFHNSRWWTLLVRWILKLVLMPQG